jgi:hypothetical protein
VVLFSFQLCESHYVVELNSGASPSFFCYSRDDMHMVLDEEVKRLGAQNEVSPIWIARALVANSPYQWVVITLRRGLAGNVWWHLAVEDPALSNKVPYIDSEAHLGTLVVCFILQPQT